jgi:hypothetical protein
MWIRPDGKKNDPTASKWASEVIRLDGSQRPEINGHPRQADRNQKSEVRIKREEPFY